MDERQLHVVSVDGPFGKRPSGKFDRQGNPVMRACDPYWVVRVLHGTVLHDHRHCSLESANSFADDIRAGRTIETWSSGVGFRLTSAAGV